MAYAYDSHKKGPKPKDVERIFQYIKIKRQ